MSTDQTLSVDAVGSPGPANCDCGACPSETMVKTNEFKHLGL